MTYRRLVGFGEALLRLTAPLGAGVETAGEFRATVGGAELNGLIAAARGGMPAVWVSALPDNPLGRLVLRHARANGVEPVTVTTSGAGPHRLGLYFLDPATSPRPPAVTYDRAGSAFAHIDADALHWDELLDADACLYVTGITPPLGTAPRAAMEAAMRTARDVGAAVALDGNYRQALWPRSAYSGWLAGVLPGVDFLAASEDDLRSAGIAGDDPITEAVRRFGLRAAITTTKRRFDQAVELAVRVVTPEGEHRAEARAAVLDQIGAGDAMYGTFLMELAGGDVAQATQQALGAAVTSYGLFGDALVAAPWDSTETRGVIR